jgi:hypothetical protein
MSISEHALHLLDHTPNFERRKKIENFLDLDQLVSSSFGLTVSETPPTVTQDSNQTGAYSVAARLNRSNYEDQARAEALMSALRQIRVSHAQSPRVIRRA